MHAAVKMNRLADLRRQRCSRSWPNVGFPKPSQAVRWCVGISRSSRSAGPRTAPFRPQSLSNARQGRTRQAQCSSRTCCVSRSQRLGSVRDRIDHGRWTASDLARYAEPELRAIAGAKVGNSATVVAVVDREPGAYEGSRLREAFGATSKIAICILCRRRRLLRGSGSRLVQAGRRQSRVGGNGPIG